MTRAGPAADEKFLPGQHLIEAFGAGGFRFNGMSHKGALLSLPSGMRRIDCTDIGGLPEAVLKALGLEREVLDSLLIGTGQRQLPLPASVKSALHSIALPGDVMSTNAAVRTYNVMLAERRRLAAILMPVDDATAR